MCEEEHSETLEGDFDDLKVTVIARHLDAQRHLQIPCQLMMTLCVETSDDYQCHFAWRSTENQPPVFHCVLLYNHEDGIKKVV